LRREPIAIVYQLVGAQRQVARALGRVHQQCPELLWRPFPRQRGARQLLYLLGVADCWHRSVQIHDGGGIANDGGEVARFDVDIDWPWAWAAWSIAFMAAPDPLDRLLAREPGDPCLLLPARVVPDHLRPFIAHDWWHRVDHLLFAPQ
jgi:hypothetical protein